MPSNNRVPISVRISQEDVDFINSLQIHGANTPSDKIRELLSEARQNHERKHDYHSMLSHAENLLHDAKHLLAVHEKELGIHSNILARLFECVPDLLAILSDIPESTDKTLLIHHERETMWRVVRLMDSILQLAVVGKGAGYDDRVLNELDNTLKLAHIINEEKNP